MKNNKKLIRNSTAEFLIFTSQSGEEGIEVRYEDKTIWLTQKLMAALFDVSLSTINEHLKNIFTSGEINRVATIRNFRIVQIEGKRQVERDVDFYNLDVIISKDSGKITAKIAKKYAESEFEKYRIIQDRLFESEFDKIIKQIDPNHKS